MTMTAPFQDLLTYLLNNTIKTVVVGNESFTEDELQLETGNDSKHPDNVYITTKDRRFVMELIPNKAVVTLVQSDDDTVN